MQASRLHRCRVTNQSPSCQSRYAHLLRLLEWIKAANTLNKLDPEIVYDECQSEWKEQDAMQWNTAGNGNDAHHRTSQRKPQRTTSSSSPRSVAQHALETSIARYKVSIGSRLQIKGSHHSIARSRALSHIAHFHISAGRHATASVWTSIAASSC